MPWEDPRAPTTQATRTSNWVGEAPSVLSSCTRQQAANSLPRGEEHPTALVNVGWLLGFTKSLCIKANMIALDNKNFTLDNSLKYFG